MIVSTINGLAVSTNLLFCSVTADYRFNDQPSSSIMRDFIKFTETPYHIGPFKLQKGTSTQKGVFYKFEKDHEWSYSPDFNIDYIIYPSHGQPLYRLLCGDDYYK